MNCRKCEKEGTLEVVIDGVEFWICEYCANSWSYKPGGQVSTKAITRVQRAQMSRATEEMDRPQPRQGL